MPPALWRLVEWTLARAIPRRHLTPILGDLVEDYERRRAILGHVRSNLWLVREAISLAAVYRVRGRLTGVRRDNVAGRLRADMAQGWRAVRSRPTATLATVAVLALGIGLVSAMFALADPYLFRPLPYARPHELAELNPRTFATRNLPTLADWQARGDLFTGLAVDSGAEIRSVRAESGDTTVRAVPVSKNYFEVLGVPVTLPDDWAPAPTSRSEPIVLTAESARRLFGRDPALGRLIRSADPDRPDLRVIHVLPPSFFPPFTTAARQADGLVPLGDKPLIHVEVTPSGGFKASSMSPIARLRPGVTMQNVEAALSTGKVTQSFPGLPTDGVAVVVRPLAYRAIEAARTMALGVLAAGVLVLIVCAANVANLLLARGAARTREFAAREALGASRLDIARLVLVELAMLTAAGASAGLLVAQSALAAASFVIPAQYATLGAPMLTWRVAAFAAAAGGLVVLAGMLPAWAAWRVTPSALFNQTTSHETRLARTLRFAMTTAQTAVAVVLLVGATLLGRSFVNLVSQDPGYDGDTFALQVRRASDDPGGRMTRAEVDTTLERLAHLRGVTHAAVADGSLVGDVQSVGLGPTLTINGRRVRASQRRVSPGFFTTTRSRLVSGHLSDAQDQGRSVVVNEAFTRACCDGGSPLGAVFSFGQDNFEIVGVVRNIYTTALDEEPGPMVFVPLTAAPVSFVTYLLRADRVDPTLALAAEREVVAVNRHAIVTDGTTMRQRLMRSVSDRPFATLIAVFFAIAAVGVSAAGLVGVVSFVVARRTREVAIRMAIGAAATDVLRLVTREAVLASVAGAVLGFAGAFWATRFIQVLVYGIRPADPLSFAAAAVLVFAMVTLAAWIPARRATRLSPTVALRVE